MLGVINPIGIYLLLSEDTSGMTMYVVVGIFSTWKCVGLSANFTVPALLLASLISRTASTRFKHSGIFRSSLGEQSPSHRQKRGERFINS